MVDFKKHLTGEKTQKPVQPIEIYKNLDRAYNTGTLKPAQEYVLKKWFDEFRTKKDVIVKMHTGQGKTLVGLLMLQSRLNDNKGPALYLCPNNFLVGQTLDEAKRFGIPASEIRDNGDLPDNFLQSKSVLVASVKKLFNGLTRFGLFNKSLKVDTLLMDDAHTCSDIIRETFRIYIPSDTQAYLDILSLFATDLEHQGAGTFLDIKNNRPHSLLPVPYWAWATHKTDVANILSKYANDDNIKFVWPLIKNNLEYCKCVFSGDHVEIEPYLSQLNYFGSYWKASHKIFMSATVTDDAFLVKGLRISPETITNPLIYPNEKWYGEKMVLLPSLIHESLDRGLITAWFGKSSDKKSFGIVVLVNSFDNARGWESSGAIIVNKDNIFDVIKDIRFNAKYENTIVLVNRYDGIDLPDNACRILIIDGKPFSGNLIDLYEENCRPNSQITFMRFMRTLEQGMGRSVRGEKDYSVVIIASYDIIKLFMDKKSRKYLSPQTSTQINIGLDISEMVKKEIEDGIELQKSVKDLIGKCLKRDSDWKEFYAEKMGEVDFNKANEHILNLFKMELDAEEKYEKGDINKALDTVQSILDKKLNDSDDYGWYLQEMARYKYSLDSSESEKMQIAAHKSNFGLLKPKDGIVIEKLTMVSHKRMERIIVWLKKFDNYNEMYLSLSETISKLKFGVKADKFESGLEELGNMLGFMSERPEKKYGRGPDNLWALNDTQYILWECKNEVKKDRGQIYKSESGQINTSCAWFKENYKNFELTPFIIHPSDTLSNDSSFNENVKIMIEKNLNDLLNNVSLFFKSFMSADFRSLSSKHIQELINNNNLSVENIINIYTITPRRLKNY